MKLNTKQKINMLAIEVLEQFGFYEPTQMQIDNVEAQLQRMLVADVFSGVDKVKSAQAVTAH